MQINIKKATDADFDSGIWEIFHTVISAGDTYIYPPSTTKEEAREIWMENTVPYVACNQNDEIIGSYLIRQNRVGLGSHICNAAYIVHPDFQGHGIGQKMCEHSLKEAKEQGYKAMQFNIVVSTNKRAIYLWQKMGFTIIGTVPKSFQHKEKGLVDSNIMHRFL